MKSSKQKTSDLRLPKGVLVGLIGILLAILSIIVGLVIVINMSDGTERFSGDEQLVAKQELAVYIESSTTSTEKIGSFGTLKYYVDSVKEEPVPAVGGYSTCRVFYRINISERSIFGLTRDNGYRFGCLR